MRNYDIDKSIILRTPAEGFKSVFKEEDLISNFKNPRIQESIFLASPELYYRLKEWIQEGQKKEKKSDKLKLTLYKYLTRLHTRSTPFGLFAGCVKGSWGTSTNIKLHESKRLTRLDMQLLTSFIDYIERVPEIRKQLYFEVNSSFYKWSNKKARFVQYTLNNHFRKYHLTDIELDTFLEKIITKAKAHPSTIVELAKEIVNEDISNKDAEKYILEIIESQILVSNLQPKLTEEEVLINLIKTLKALVDKTSFIEEIIEKLEGINEILKTIDKNSINPISSYESIIKIVNSFGINYDKKKVFHVDFFKTTEDEFTLSSNIKKELTNYLLFLNKIYYPSYKNQDLKKFGTKFLEKFGTKEIPLALALDPEIGVNYPIENKSKDINELLIDVDFLNTKINKKNNLSNIQLVLLNKFIEAYKKQELEIDISDIELPFKDFKNLDDTFSCVFNVVGKNKNGEDIIRVSSSSANATKLLGRFSFGNEDIKKIVKSLALKEDNINSNTIIADLLHSPQPKAANVISHCAIRKYEIPYLTSSGLEKKFQIPIEDILVSVNLSKEIILRSRRYNKIIIPRLTNAHNHNQNNSLPIYRFLADLQYQNKIRGLRFSSGNIGFLLKYTPRVMWKNIIVQRATWKFKKNNLKKVFENYLTDQKSFESWKADNNLPNYILLVEGDNELFFNLNDDFSVRCFFQTTKSKNEVTIKEFLYDSFQSNAIINSKNDFYMNEFIVNFIKKTKNNQFLTESQVEKSNLTSVKRKYSIGSEWVFLKIYCGHNIGESILENIYNLIIKPYVKNKHISNWFFIKYNDPDFHIRLRIKTSRKEHISEILNKINLYTDKLLKNGAITNIIADTYDREIERYGGNTIELSEKLFDLDSFYCLKIISKARDLQEERLRWLYAISLIDMFLTEFKLNLNDKFLFSERLKNSYGAEFGFNKRMKKKLDKKYRLYEKEIFDILNNSFSFEEIHILINEYKLDFVEITSQIISLNEKNKLEVDFYNLITSYIHMSINRLFISDQRQHEMVLYYFLFLYYRAEVGKMKYLHHYNE